MILRRRSANAEIRRAMVLTAMGLTSRFPQPVALLVSQRVLPPLPHRVLRLDGLRPLPHLWQNCQACWPAPHQEAHRLARLKRRCRTLGNCRLRHHPLHRCWSWS